MYLRFVKKNSRHSNCPVCRSDVDRRNLVTIFFSRRNQAIQQQPQQQRQHVASTTTAVSSIPINFQASPSSVSSAVAPIAPARISTRRTTRSTNTASSVSSAVGPITAARIISRRPTRSTKITDHFNLCKKYCALCGNAFTSTTDIVVCDYCRRRL